MPKRLHEWLVQQGALSVSNEFQPYQIFTHMFSHSPASLFHILFNMFALWMFGRVLENYGDPNDFCIFILSCGLGAAALHLGILYIRCEPTMGCLILANNS